MEVRPGFLYAIPELIRLVGEFSLGEEDLHTSFPVINEVPSRKLVELACEAGWIQRDSEGRLVVLPRGASLRRIPSAQTVLVAQLEDIIWTTRPIWAAKLTQGRKEFVKTAPDDIVQCFRAAGLLDDDSRATIALLDSMQSAIRGARQDDNLSTGRTGERLTMVFEEIRTGSKPDWTAIDTNRAGYDVLSFEGPGSRRRLPIEVKATTSGLVDGLVYLTRYECDTAARSHNYRFHCWMLHDPPRLFDVPKASMLANVPLDQRDGEWQSVRVPFASLAESEVAVPAAVEEVIARSKDLSINRFTEHPAPTNSVFVS